MEITKKIQTFFTPQKHGFVDTRFGGGSTSSPQIEGEGFSVANAMEEKEGENISESVQKLKEEIRAIFISATRNMEIEFSSTKKEIENKIRHIEEAKEMRKLYQKLKTAKEKTLSPSSLETLLIDQIVYVKKYTKENGDSLFLKNRLTNLENEYDTKKKERERAFFKEYAEEIAKFKEMHNRFEINEPKENEKSALQKKLVLLEEEKSTLLKGRKNLYLQSLPEEKQKEVCVFLGQLSRAKRGEQIMQKITAKDSPKKGWISTITSKVKTLLEERMPIIAIAKKA